VNNLPLLEDLRLFCVVVRNMSFIASAKELGTSPAYVSKRIGILEDVLNVRLLHRTTRRVNMTHDGETIYRWAQQIIEEVEQMTEAVATSKTTPRGQLRISTSAGFGRKRLAPALSEIARHYPALRIQLELLDRPVDLVGEGFDVDIRVGGTSEPNLMVQKIAANARVLCAAPSYVKLNGMPLRLSDLGKHNCIVIRERDQSFGVWKLQGPKGMETIKVAGSLSCNNGEIVRQWAIDGHGIILRSIWDVGSDLKEGRLARVLPGYQQQADICAVYPLKLTESAKVRVCVEFLKMKLGRQVHSCD
jgi:LysR family transcriptional regulator, transcriptional activator for dmlA